MKKNVCLTLVPLGLGIAFLVLLLALTTVPSHAALNQPLLHSGAVA